MTRSETIRLVSVLAVGFLALAAGALLGGQAERRSPVVSAATAESPANRSSFCSIILRTSRRFASRSSSWAKSHQSASGAEPGVSWEKSRGG